MNFDQIFGEVRSLLDGRPSPMAFDLVCQHIDLAAEQDALRAQEELLVYVASKLEAWPDADRLCPKHLVEAFESNAPLWGPLVRALDYEGLSLTKKRMEELFALEHAADLTWLDLRSAKMKWPQLEDLAARAPFRLKHFGFRRASKIDWDVLDALFGSEMLSQVESLNFRGWDKIKSKVYPHMIEHFPLENLRRLDLSGGAVSARRLKELLETDRLDQLEELRVGSWVSDKACSGVLALVAKRDSVTNLHTLQINEAKPREFKALAKAEHLASVRELIIDYGIDVQSMALLADSPLANLEHLEVSLNGYEDPDANGFLDALASAPWLDQLHTLSVNWYRPDDVDTVELTRLLGASSFSNLRRLRVPVRTVADLEALAQATHLDRLTDLTLTDFTSDDAIREAARALFNAPHLQSVSALILDSGRDSSQAVRALIDSTLLPHCARLRILECPKEALLELFDAEGFEGVEFLSITRLGFLADREVLPALARSTRTAKLKGIELSTRATMQGHAEGTDSTLPELLHITCPEYAFLQQHDWL